MPKTTEFSVLQSDLRNKYRWKISLSHTLGVDISNISPLKTTIALEIDNTIFNVDNYVQTQSFPNINGRLTFTFENRYGIFTQTPVVIVK